MIQPFETMSDSPLAGDSFTETSVLQNAYTSTRKPVRLSDKLIAGGDSVLCQGNCSGNGECMDGSCYCMVNMVLLLIDIKQVDE